MFPDVTSANRIKGGDVREFEGLFRKYYGPLCRYANKILNDRDGAEDLVQDFFYQLWKNRERFTPRFSLNAYFYQSVRNNALNVLRNRSVKERHSQNVYAELMEQIPSDTTTPFELNELNKVLQTTLNQMPQRCSTVFCMNRFEGKKYREIADILLVSVKTVEADMGKALKILRKSLKEYTGKGAGVTIE